MTAEMIAFLVLAVATIAGGIVCLWSRYVVHSAFGLMLALVGVAGLFVLLQSDFLAVAQIVIYVGGVVILYLFGVMLTPPDMEERSVKRVLGLGLGGLVVFLFLLRGIAASASAGRIARPAPEESVPPEGTIIYELGRQLMAREGYVLPFMLIAVLLLVALCGAVFIARRREAES